MNYIHTHQDLNQKRIKHKTVTYVDQHVTRCIWITSLPSFLKEKFLSGLSGPLYCICISQLEIE